MPKNKNLVMVFAKKPVKGKVKTRLAKSVGEQKALEIYKQLLTRVVTNLNGKGYDKWLFWDSVGKPNPDIDFLDIANFDSFDQEGSDLGEKLKNAFKQAFSQYQKVIVIGSDCPFVQDAVIQEALELMDSADVIVGPAFDGGYYLLGLKQLEETLFENIEWGTELVYVQTMDTVKAQGLSYDILNSLSDIDTEADLAKLK